MSQPPVPYDRLFNFETFSTTNPTVQQPGVQIDGELDALKITVDSVISRLSEIQRSDGKLNPQAFESTGIPEAIATQAYSQTYAQLQPLVLAASQSAVNASISASTAENHANAADASATEANAAIAPAVAAKDLAVTKAAEAQNWAVQANASASTAASAEVETQSHKQSTLDARNEAQQALSSVINLKASLDNQYDNMLDADQNLADVASKSESVTNLGLNAEDQSDRSVYNRVLSMLGMYVTPDSGNIGSQPNLSIDSYLQQNFGLVFNHQTGLFQTADGYFGTFFGRGIEGSNGPAEESTIGTGNTPTSQLAWRVSVLKLRLSVMASIFRTTFKEVSRYYGYNGDNRIVTLQDFANGQPNSILKFNVWSLVSQNVNDAIQEVLASGGGSEIADINGLQAALDAKATTVALSSGLAGKANTSHSQAISTITGLQTALDGKSSTSHTHTISSITSLQTTLDAKTSNVLPQTYSYDQSTTASVPGRLYVLGYDGGTDGTVVFSGSVGSRFFFYQSANATNSIGFTGAIQNENKLFTKGPKSWVEAVITPEGVVLNGDLMFPPSGTLISSSCDYVYVNDAKGTGYDGNFYSNNVYADGSGGTYSTGGYNQNGCWYPYGFCMESEVILSESQVSWSGCSSSGTTPYSYSFGDRRADGYGGVYEESVGGWSAYYGDVIYDDYNGCTVRHDGSGGYYVEDTSGSYPAYGDYIGEGSGTLYIYYGYNIGDLAVGTYTNQQYADGSGGVAYTENQYDSYYSYGTYLAYDDYNGYSVYSDGNGSYYTSY